VAIVVVALVVVFNVRLIDARNRALASEARVQRIHGLMLNLFDGDDQAAGPAEGLRVVSLLERGVREAEGLENDPDLQAELRHTFGELYLKLGHPDRAEPLLTAALDARRSLFGEEDDRTMRTQQAVAQLRIEQSRLDEAEQLARAALEVAERRFSPESRELAAARAVLGKVHASNGDYDKAIAMLEPAVAVLSKLPPGVELSEALGDLANTHYYLGHVDVSESLNRRALPIERELFGDRHPHVAVTLYNLGNIRLDYGDYAEGERLFRRALELNESWYGTTHPRAASSALMLGRAIAYQNRPDEARDLYERALAGFRAAYGEKHIRVASALSLIGDLTRDAGKLDEAERSFDRAASIFRSITGEQHEFYVHQLSNLGSVYLAQGRYTDAERVLRTAVSYFSANLPGHRYTGLAEMRLAATLSAREQYVEAEQHAAIGYRVLQALPGSSAVELEDARTLLAGIYAKLGLPEKGKALASDMPPVRASSGKP
jgi:serine/threonine-protein kinase